MATKLLTIPISGDVAPSLAAFMPQISWLLFHMLGENGEWLLKEVKEWKDDNEDVFMCVHDLKVTNDCAERCIKDVTKCECGKRLHLSF